MNAQQHNSNRLSLSTSNRTIRLASALALALSVFWTVPASAVDFSEKEKALLKAGKTIIKELPTSRQKGFYGGSGYAVVNAPIEAVWRAIQDWKAYTEMFPNTELCRAVGKKGNHTLIRMKIGHPVVNVEYHAEMVDDPAKYTMSFNLVTSYPHDMDSIKGYWRLFPQKNGTTLVAYVAAIQAPMGIVAIAGEDLANRAIQALLGIPGDLKKWVEGPNGIKYKK